MTLNRLFSPFNEGRQRNKRAVSPLSQNHMTDTDGTTDPDFLAWQEKVRDSNVSEQTLLATDYLNHFNEIVMTLEMVPDMPELLDEAKAWAPKSYQDHFRDSSIADKDLAVEAYDHVPAKFKVPFEATIEQANNVVIAGIQRIEKEIERGSPELLRVAATTTSHLLQKLMDHAGANIHGSVSTMDQSDIDALLD